MTRYMIYCCAGTGGLFYTTVFAQIMALWDNWCTHSQQCWQNEIKTYKKMSTTIFENHELKNSAVNW